MRERKVLIGTTAQSIKDVFYTPLNGDLFGSSQPMTGVTVHANIISQIISAVLDKRPLIHVWDDSIEWLWILAWAWLGAVISRQLKSPLLSAICIVFASGGFLGLCFLAFLLGWWLEKIEFCISIGVN